MPLGGPGGGGGGGGGVGAVVEGGVVQCSGRGGAVQW